MWSCCGGEDLWSRAMGRGLAGSGAAAGQNKSRAELRREEKKSDLRGEERQGALEQRGGEEQWVLSVGVAMAQEKGAEREEKTMICNSYL